MSSLTFADKVIRFNKKLSFGGALPQGIRLMNPFTLNVNALVTSSTFYKKYYNDTAPRYMILGINPGRFGAGLTGVPFTDPKRMQEKCGIAFQGNLAHEPSSVFVYDVAEAYGGVDAFYKTFYINSPCPLGLVRQKGNKEVNCNYYDSKVLKESLYEFILESMEKHLSLGIKTNVAFCLGIGANYDFLHHLNQEKKYFEKIIPLEHPRYVMQYRSKDKQAYINKYLEAFANTNHDKRAYKINE